MVWTHIFTLQLNLTTFFLQASKGPFITPYKLQSIYGFVLRYLSVPTILSIVLWYFLRSTSTRNLLFYYDYVHGGGRAFRHICEKGKFSLPYMDECVPWLTCRDIESNKFEIKKAIGNGAVKIVS